MFKLCSLVGGIALIASCSAGDIVTDSQGNDGQDTGGGDTGLTNDPNEPTEPNFGSISMLVTDSNLETSLGKSGVFSLNIESIDGFAGEVALAPSNIPSGWNLNFEPSDTVILEAGESKLVELRVDVETTGTSGSQGFSVNASNINVESQSLELSADVENVVDVVIANNTGGQAHSFASPTINLGTALRFVNMDTNQPHRIHSNYEGVGFPHQPNNLQLAPSVGAAGGTYEITVTQAGLYSGWYCHVHGRNMGEGQFTVVE